MRWSTRHIIALYRREGNPRTDMPFDRYAVSTHPERSTYKDTGWFQLWKDLIRSKAVGRVTVVVETERHCGQVELAPHIKLFCVPDVNLISKWMYHDWLPVKNVVFLVHGYVPEWHAMLSMWNNYNKWILMYPDNDVCGYAKIAPSYCNIVLDEQFTTTVRLGPRRTILPFRRPVNDRIFYPSANRRPAPVDLCIGNAPATDESSHLLILEAAAAYRRRYDNDLRCVMPAPTGKVPTEIAALIARENLNVEIDQFTDKQFRRIFIGTGLFVHAGPENRRDPGPVEAMACGCPVMTAHGSGTAAFVTNNSELDFSVDPADDPFKIAEALHEALRVARDRKYRDRISGHFRQHNDMDRAVVPEAAQLFNSLFTTVPLNGVPGEDHDRPGIQGTD